MSEIENREEMLAVDVAYAAWASPVVAAHEQEAYTAGWLAGRDWQRDQAERPASDVQAGELGALRDLVHAWAREAADVAENAKTDAHAYFNQGKAFGLLRVQAHLDALAPAPAATGAGKRPNVTDHEFCPAIHSGEDMCTYSWRVESERTYCQRPASEHRSVNPAPPAQASEE